MSASGHGGGETAMDHKRVLFGNLKIKDLLKLLVAIEISVVLLIQFFYYSRFYGIVKARAEVYASNTVNQVNEKLSSTADNIKKAATTAAYNTTAQDYLANDQVADRLFTAPPLQNLLQSIVDSNSCIADIALLDSQSNLFTTNQKITYSTLDDLSRDYGIDAQTLDKPVYTQVLKDYVGDSGESYYCYIIPIYNMHSVKQRLGTCIVLCDISYLSDIVNNTSATPNSVFAVMDNKKQIVVSNKKNIGGDMEKLLASPSLSAVSQEWQGEIPFGGKTSIVRIKINQNLQWQMVSIIPVEELTSDLAPILQVGIAIWIFIVILLLFIGAILNRSITKPISELEKQIDTIGDKSIKQRVVMQQKNEIGMIADDVNLMLDKIEKLTGNIFKMQNMLYEAEIRKKETEFTVLQSQINPHFLYNTLECIRSIALSHRIMEIVNISTAMAKIFRYSIKGSDYPRIRDEIDCVRDYLSIIAIRYMDKFTTSVETDAVLLDRPILKMILQPIVENAVYHGLEPMEEPGKLDIKGNLCDGNIIFTVWDNGVGMEQEEMDELNRSFLHQKRVRGMLLSTGKHLALANINSRIKLHYGNAYGLHVESQKGVGTKVTIRLPFEEEGKVQEDCTRE